MTVPSFSGSGYLAGESPDGLTTVVGVPVSATVQVLWRDPDTDEEHLVASTTSAGDGSWQVTGINHEIEYVVRGIKSGWDDVTVVGVTPSRMDVITTTGTLETNEERSGLSGSLLIEGGLPPYSVSVIDPLPYGLSPSIDYRTLTVTGTSEDWGRWNATLRITAANSVTLDVPVTVDIVTGWTPADLTTAPQLWFDDESPVSDVSGSASQWDDQSTNAWHFTQGSSGAMPTINASGLNGRRTLTFDGSSDFLTAPVGALGALRNTTAGWCLVVYNAAGTSTSDRPIFYAAVGSGSGGRFAMEAGAPSAQNRPFVYGRRLDSDSFGGVGHGSAITGAWTMALGVLDFSSRTASISVNGSAPTTATGLWSGAGNTSNTDSTGMRLGSSTNGSLKFGGSVAAVIVGVGSIPSGAEIDRLFGWSAWRYGMPSLLPSDHPFRHEAPYMATPMLQQSLATAPVVLGFMAAVSGSDVGAATGPAVTALGTWFNGGPNLSAGQGIEVISDSTDITVTLTAITPPDTPARAVLLDHEGVPITTVTLTASGGDYTGMVAGELDDGAVYYLRIEAA